MLRLLIPAMLVLSVLSLEAAGQDDDEFDFDRRPRRPAPIPDDFDDMPGQPTFVPERQPSRRAPSELDRRPRREPLPATRPNREAPRSAGELPRPPLKYIFAGSQGTFAVIGGSGQAAYRRQTQPYLVGLRYVRRDERFSYWWAAVGDPTALQWAFSRRAGPDGRHTVWQRTPAGWRYFDRAIVSKPR